MLAQVFFFFYKGACIVCKYSVSRNAFSSFVSTASTALESAFLMYLLYWLICFLYEQYKTSIVLSMYDCLSRYIY